MAATTDVSRDIETNLWAITAEADFLPELEAGWEEDTEDQQVVWYLEWQELLSRLKVLEQHHSANMMTDEQRERYRALRAELQGHRPLMERLRLPLPPALSES